MKGEQVQDWERCRGYEPNDRIKFLLEMAEKRRQQREAEFAERLAALAHRQWAGWMEWMLAKWNDRHASGEPYQARWQRQMATPYADLSETEKERDRTEARKVIGLLRELGVLEVAE